MCRLGIWPPWPPPPQYSKPWPPQYSKPSYAYVIKVIIFVIKRVILLSCHHRYVANNPREGLLRIIIRDRVKNTTVVECTVQILCIGTDRSQQTVQTKIRLLLKQSDQGLRCLPFHQHLLDALMQSYIKLFYF